MDMKFSDILDASGKFMILSPHLDDAALSVPTLITNLVKSKKQILCVNGFTVSPYAPGLKTKNVKAISRARKKEDAAALKYLGKNIKSTNLDFLDAPLRGVKNVTGKNPVTAKEKIITNKISTLIAAKKDYFIIAPLGVLHIDHIVMAEAVLRLVQKGVIEKNRLMFYEELPVSGAASLEYIGNRARVVAKRLCAGIKPLFISFPGLTALKKKMASFYPSQILAQDLGIVLKHTKRLKNRERVWVFKGKR
jgi:LmbE family N-acetylglucosaminyl deacetylase